LLRQYQRGVITHRELANRVVAATAGQPTQEFVNLLPVEVVDVIRSQASQPADTKWVFITSCCTGDIEAWQAAQREEQTRWQAGLAWWREYLGFGSGQAANG